MRDGPEVVHPRRLVIRQVLPLDLTDGVRQRPQFVRFLPLVERRDRSFGVLGLLRRSVQEVAVVLRRLRLGRLRLRRQLVRLEEALERHVHEARELFDRLHVPGDVDFEAVHLCDFAELGQSENVLNHLLLLRLALHGRDLSALPLDDRDLALQVLLELQALLSELVVLFLDLHRHLDLLLRVPVANLHLVQLELEPADLRLQVLVVSGQLLLAPDCLEEFVLLRFQPLLQVLLLDFSLQHRIFLSVLVLLDHVDELLDVLELGLDLGLFSLQVLVAGRQLLHLAVDLLDVLSILLHFLLALGLKLFVAELVLLDLLLLGLDPDFVQLFELLDFLLLLLVLDLQVGLIGELLLDLLNDEYQLIFLRVYLLDLLVE